MIGRDGVQDFLSFSSILDSDFELEKYILIKKIDPSTSVLRLPAIRHWIKVAHCA